MRQRRTALLLVSLVLVGAVTSPVLARAWIANAAGMRAWHDIAEGTFDLRICTDVAVLVHAQRMGCLLQASAISDRAVLGRFEAASMELTTLESAMLRVSQANVAWAAGDNNAACRLLSGISADDEIRDFAERSSAAKDWPALAIYVDCFAALRPRGDFADPYRAADLAYRLGAALEGSGQSDQAATAFRRAATWYPDIWSDSTVKFSQLAGQNPEQPRTVASLRDALRRSPDPRALFQSWQAQGVLSDPSRNTSLAVCALTQGDRCASPQ